MNIPLDESRYVISLEEVFWGGTLLSVTMALHGWGMITILRVNGALNRHFEAKPTFRSGLFILILTSWLIMVVHLIEVIVWSLFFYWKEAFPTQSLSYYFALNEYTTIGSNYNLPLHWR